MDRSDVEMKKGLVQGGGPDGDSVCGGLALSSRSFSKPAADPEDLQTPENSGLWRLAISWQQLEPIQLDELEVAIWT